jgi:hypothetical protein
MNSEARRDILRTVIARRRLLSNRELAAKHGVSLVAVKSLIRRRFGEKCNG